MESAANALAEIRTQVMPQLDKFKAEMNQFDVMKEQLLQKEAEVRRMLDVAAEQINIVMASVNQQVEMAAPNTADAPVGNYSPAPDDQNVVTSSQPEVKQELVDAGLAPNFSSRDELPNIPLNEKASNSSCPQCAKDFALNALNDSQMPIANCPHNPPINPLITTMSEPTSSSSQPMASTPMVRKTAAKRPADDDHVPTMFSKYARIDIDALKNSNPRQSGSDDRNDGCSSGSSSPSQWPRIPASQKKRLFADDAESDSLLDSALRSICVKAEMNEFSQTYHPANFDQPTQPVPSSKSDKLDKMFSTVFTPEFFNISKSESPRVSIPIRPKVQPPKPKVIQPKPMPAPNVGQGLFPCPTCQMTVDTERKLKMHQTKFHTNPDWMCTFVTADGNACGATFHGKVPATVIQHIRKIHFGLPLTKKEQDARNIIDDRDPKMFIRKLF